MAFYTECRLVTRHLSLYQLAGEITRQMGPWDYVGCHETVPLG